MAYLVTEMNHHRRRIWKPAAIETALHAISELLLSMLLSLSHVRVRSGPPGFNIRWLPWPNHTWKTNRYRLLAAPHHKQRGQGCSGQATLRSTY